MLYKIILLIVLYMMKMTYSEYRKTSVMIDTDTIIETISDRFLSVTLDTSFIQDNWSTLNFSSPKVQVLAKALSPCYLRVGGSSADYLQFDSSSQSEIYQKVPKEFILTDRINKKLTNFTMIARQWDELNGFAEMVGWDLIFDLNSLLRQNGQWLPDNAKLLMDYTSQKGYKIAGWELGNEPDVYKDVGPSVTMLVKEISRKYLQDFVDAGGPDIVTNPTFHHKYTKSYVHIKREPDVYKDVGINITGAQRAKDYNILHSLLNHYPQWRNGIVIGPSVTMLVKEISRKYLQDFVDAGGPDIVNQSYIPSRSNSSFKLREVNNPIFHHYYDYGPSMTVPKFMAPDILSNLPWQINVAKKIAPFPLFGKFWLGETSSAWGGGAAGLSDRYVAGFMWLDKLGISASLGVDVVVRQTFYGGSYGLIDTKTSNPNPDFWLSYLYKKLVGRSVFNVTMDDNKGYVRMYTHCTNTQRSDYKPGSITVYGMNLRQEPTTVVFTQFKPDIKLHLYLLEPVGVESLKSQTIALNGRTLSLNPDFSLPSMDYPEVVTSNFTFPQQSFGFIVIPEANVAACKMSSL
ncbi:HPSE [Mytilus coruscus]|uniref:HPSE n=1 Tax=Mytilus coruscus TaxID=42192 RepID=A0A6J8ADT7_MYTCO|nr:HPSE [Mytilus coruscus]